MEIRNCNSQVRTSSLFNKVRWWLHAQTSYKSANARKCTNVQQHIVHFTPEKDSSTPIIQNPQDYTQIYFHSLNPQNQHNVESHQLSQQSEIRQHQIPRRSSRIRNIHTYLMSHNKNSYIFKWNVKCILYSKIKSYCKIIQC